MSSVVEKIRKRAFYPIKLRNGETIHLRGMKHSERREAESFGNEQESWGYAIGVGLLNEDGSQAFTRQPEETPKAFGARVLDELDPPDDIRAEIIETLVKLSNGAKDFEAIVKN